MTATVLKEMFSYQPELQSLIKSAEDLTAIMEGFPTGSEALTMLSMAKLSFMEKVAKVQVPPNVSDQVKQAATLYGVKDVVEESMALLATTLMEKRASDSHLVYEVSVAINKMLTLDRDNKVDELVKVASHINADYSEVEGLIGSSLVSIYSGASTLDRGSTLQALEKRAFLTRDSIYSELATVLSSKDFSGFTKEANEKVLAAIHDVDKSFHLGIKGWNIYKEARVKSAAENIKLGKTSASLERILDVIPALQDALGAETVKEIVEAGQEAGPIIASLPMDLKAIIATYV